MFKFTKEMKIHLFILLAALIATACSKPDTPEVIVQKPKQDTTSTAVVESYMEFAPSTSNQMTVTTQSAFTYQLRTTGTDPYAHLNPLTKSLTAKQCVLTFEYMSSAAVSFIQVFFGSPITEERSVKSSDNGLAATTAWKTWSIDLADERAKFGWGDAGQFLRLDFGDVSGIVIMVRNICFRERTAAEEAAAAEREAALQALQKLDENLQAYLAKTYSSAVTRVEAAGSKITVHGTYSGSGKTLLCEVRPWQNVVEMKQFDGVELVQPSFSVELDRYVMVDGINYDRALSQWAIVQNDALASHARYTDRIAPSRAMTEQKLLGRKGRGGYGADQPFQEDIDDIPVTSVTVNIPIGHFMYLARPANAIVHTYGGKTYYFEKNYVESLDRTMRKTASKNIIVSAIILISNCVDPSLKPLLWHPNAVGSAPYSMPNMTTAESANCYAAALDFLADRYSRPDNEYGRIHHYILHNEVDAGSEWTNMGAATPLYVYLNAYYKSMRLCYNIARCYDEHSQALASFTHSWTKPAMDYATLDMINGLLKYSATEGDFQWGLAHHPYPQDLFEPKTWNDNLATFSMTSPFVTFKNLEVLDKWAKTAANKYLGTHKRTVWLSEQGTNSRTYSAQDLHEQAAGFAYTWKKFKHLDGIDAFQWHNWVDNRAEGGLRIGLRRFTDDGDDPGGRKPVWYLFQAADTFNEDAVFEQYKATIGIGDWAEVLHEVY